MRMRRIGANAKLVWRLVKDRRIGFWKKLFLFGLPVAYLAVPLPDDVLPVVGLLDDLLLLVLATGIFLAVCPRAIVAEHVAALDGLRNDPTVARIEKLRNSKEHSSLVILFAMLVVLAVLGGYLAGIILFMLFGAGFLTSVFMRFTITANAMRVSEAQRPDLHAILRRAQEGLPPVRVNLFVAQNPVMNAFTFGFREPYSIVVSSALVERFTPEELQAVLAHELGHVVFGHVRTATMFGADRGPAKLLFLKWSRHSEFSADAVGLFTANGDPKPMISTLLKLASGLSGSFDISAYLDQLNAESAQGTTAAEYVSSHPFLTKRVQALVRLAQSDAFTTAPASPA